MRICVDADDRVRADLVDKMNGIAQPVIIPSLRRQKQTYSKILLSFIYMVGMQARAPTRILRLRAERLPGAQWAK